MATPSPSGLVVLHLELELKKLRRWHTRCARRIRGRRGQASLFCLFGLSCFSCERNYINQIPTTRGEMVQYVDSFSTSPSQGTRSSNESLRSSN